MALVTNEWNSYNNIKNITVDIIVEISVEWPF